MPEKTTKTWSWNTWSWKTTIRVCNWHACKGYNSKYVLERACNALNIPETWWTVDWGQVTVEHGPCLWMCDKWPNVKIVKENWSEEMLSHMNPSKMWWAMNPYKIHKNKKAEEVKKSES